MFIVSRIRKKSTVNKSTVNVSKVMFCFFFDIPRSHMSANCWVGRGAVLAEYEGYL